MPFRFRHGFGGLLLAVFAGAAPCGCSDTEPDRAAGPPPAQEQIEPESPVLPPPGGPGGPREAPTQRDIARATAPDAASQPESVDWSGGDAAKGRALYASHCSLCHGTSGSGDGLGAAALNPKPRDFTDGTFYFDTNANNETGEPIDLARVIHDGAAAYGGSEAMQAWGEVFSTDEIRDLAAHVRALAVRR